MKNIILCASAMLFAILLSTPGCKKPVNCDCETWENCIAGDCVVKEHVYFLGETGIEGENLYVGIVGGDVCGDTILLNVQSDDQFNLYVKRVEASRIFAYDIDPIVSFKHSDTHYYLTSFETMCDNLYPGMNTRIYSDSVTIEFDFRLSPASEPLHYGYATLLRK